MPAGATSTTTTSPALTDPAPLADPVLGRRAHHRLPVAASSRYQPHPALAIL
ncbi:hypothetical protein ABZ281_29875 [Streptomyces sp. NPDC006265]|uniref:hypothetical protein n=1 Tax=Streptomyces sp. NPDC006265 TaxID=3156740 RepID=UPI0033ACAC58